jgi:hypothetical protein
VRIIAATVICVLHPVGPLPASVYWRRRALAFAGVVALLLLFWAVLPGGGGDDRPRDSAAAAGSPSPTEPAAAPTSVDPSGLTASAAPGGGPGPAGDGGPAVPATSTAAPTPKPTPKPATPKACADSELRLTVAPARPAYVVGQAPVLRLQIRNVGTLSCIRDLGAALQEVLLYRGSQRLWSSNDCYPDDTHDVQVLRPGAQETFSVTWSGLGSRPKCAGARTRIGAGGYALVARLGTLVSPRAPIALR